MSQPDEENQLSEISTAEPQATSESPETHEKQPPRLYGYLATAELMADMPAMGMYRRFGMLNALSLLFYQADLLKLETELKQQIQQDELPGKNDRRKVCRDWSAASATDPQRKLIEQARLLLEKYNKDLLLQHKLIKLDKPRTREINYLREWLWSENMGDVRLEGPDREIWWKTYLWELVAFDAHKPDDALSDWITSRMLDVYHKLIGQRINKSNVKVFEGSPLYSKKGISRAISIIVIGLSSIFPISSILLLSYFKHERTRLIILCVYTVAFSFVLAAVSGVKRLEVFSAAAAFAAVQVVFIGQSK